MPALNNFSAAEKEDDQLGRTTQAEEKEEDPDHMDVMEEEEALEEEGSKERSPSSTSEEQSESEFIEGIDLEDIRTYVQCPICLGIIRKTRTFMECLHRFCQECIDKSMRFGNHECPACRKHVASRRSLRPDPKFDAFIAAIFGNIDSYEEQDLAFDGDELARNMQIQATIAQVSQRQSEALVKTKSSGKDAPRSQPSGSGSRRRRRNSRNMEHDTSQAAHDDDGDNNRVNASSSAEILPRKRNRRSAARSTAQPSSSSCPNNNDNNCANDVTEEAHHRDSRGIAHGFAWGKGGRRSNARQGNNNQGASSSKSVRNARLNRLVDYLSTLESNSVSVTKEIAFS